MSSYDLISNVELEIAASTVLRINIKKHFLFSQEHVSDTIYRTNLRRGVVNISSRASVKESDVPLFVNTYIRYRFASIDTSYRTNIGHYRRIAVQRIGNGDPSIRRKEIRVWHRITSTSDIKPVSADDLCPNGDTPDVLALRGLSDHPTCPRLDNCSENGLFVATVPFLIRDNYVNRINVPNIRINQRTDAREISTLSLVFSMREVVLISGISLSDM